MDSHDLSPAAILESLPDGAYVTDLDRRIVYWNRAAAAITGWPRSEVIGRRCGDNILCHVDKDGHRLCGREHCPLHRCMVTGQASAQGHLLFARHKEGALVPMEVNVAPLMDDDGRTIGGVEVFRDRTEALAEYARARRIQTQALECAAGDPRVAFAVQYTPQDMVGGDFYRVETIRPGLYAILVADVTGHGTAAALYTMQMRALWEELHAHRLYPAQFLRCLNERLFQLTRHDDRFATALFATLDTDQFRLTYSCAGSPMPLLAEPQGTVRYIPPSRGAALGLFRSTEYRECTIPVAPGSHLVFYTDGAFEVCDSAGRELGPEGLEKLVREELRREGTICPRRLEEQFLRYSNALRLQDDLTLLVASILPSRQDR